MQQPTTLVQPDIEFRYIEDPEIIALLREISVRWPFLAQSADHPLTEYFIHRQRLPNFYGPLFANLRWFFTSIIIVFFALPLIEVFYAVNTAESLIILIYAVIYVCFVLIVSRFSVIVRSLSRRALVWRALKHPQQLILKDLRWNSGIWLTGLTLPEYFAIVAAFRYWSVTKMFKTRIMYMILFTLIYANVFFIIFTYPHSVSTKMSTVKLFILGLVAIRFFSDPVLSTYIELRRIGWVVKRYLSPIDLFPAFLLGFGIAAIWRTHNHVVASHLYFCVTILLLVLTRYCCSQAAKARIDWLDAADRYKFDKLLAPDYAKEPEPQLWVPEERDPRDERDKKGVISDGSDRSD